MSVTHFDAVDKVWSGPNRDINVDKHENLGAYLLANLESDPERVAQVIIYQQLFPLKCLKVCYMVVFCAL